MIYSYLKNGVRTIKNMQVIIEYRNNLFKIYLL